MRKEYVKPEIAVEEFITVFCMNNTSGGDVTDEDVIPFSNDREEGRTWGNLWD